MFRPIAVEALDDYKIWVKYSDGVSGIVSLAHLVGKGLFKAWENLENFKAVKIDPESHAISWGPDIDICPDNIYFEILKIDPERYFSDHQMGNYQHAVNV